MKLLLVLLALMMYYIRCFSIRQLQVNASVTTINQISNYTFRFDRTTDNNYSLTAYASQQVPTTGVNATVTVTFPTNYLTISSATCLSATVNSLVVNSYNCSTSGNTIIFSNIFTSVSNLYVTGVIVMIGNIQNPSPATPSGSFSGTLGNDISIPSGTSTNGVQLTAGYFQNCTITFSPNYVYTQPSSMRVSLTPTDSHPAGATAVIQFPKSYWTNDISAQSLPITSSMSCSSLTSSVNNGLQCVGNSNFNFITANNLLSTSTTSTIGFSVSNFLSAPSNQPSDAIVITSYSGTYKIDTCTVYASGLIPNSFYSFSIVPLTTFTVNTFVGLRFQMTLSMTINQADTFSITFPNGTNFVYSAVYGTSFYSTPVISGQTVLISSDLSVTGTFAQNTDYTLTLTNFQAPASTIPTSPIILQIQRNGYPIMTGNASLTAVAGVLTGSVSATITTVWAYTSYKFVITTSNSLSNSGMIQIFFPSTVIIGTNSSSCAVLVGIGVNSNPFCTINSASNYILISSINGSSANIQSQSFTLTISGIINPPDISTTNSFTIYTYYSSSLQGLVETGSISGITATVGTISFTTVSVIPSSYTVLQNLVNYTISFNNTYIIPVGGYIVLQIPLDISIILTSISTYCKIAFNGLGFNSTICTGINTGTYYQINFTQAAQTLLIPANTLISLRIDSLCTNPTNTRIVSGFTIMTYSANAAIQSLTNGITVQMVTPAAFQVTNISRVSVQNSALTPYTFTLMQQASMPNASRLILTIPSFLSISADSTCTDLNLNYVSCSQDSYQALQIILPAVTGGVQFGVIVSNIRNYGSYKSLNSTFSFITKTNDQVSTYASGSLTSILANSIPSVFQQVLYSFYPGAYGDSQLLTLSITPSSYLIPSYFKVSLAPSFSIGSLGCSSLVGFTGNCSILSLRQLIVSGVFGLSKITFSIYGITSPSSIPNDYTIITSFDSSSNLIDQSSNDVIFSLGCVIPCKTCTSNTSSCLSCYNNSNISQYNIYYATNNTCLTSCPAGYYLNASILTCFVCGSPCLTCSSSNSNCTSCNQSSSYPALNISNYNGVCLPACPAQFYLSNATTPMKCVSCASACLTCSSLTVCATCAIGYYYYSQTCSNSCPSNITIANNSTQNCDACSSTCATCSGTVNNCDTCSSTAALYNKQCVSQCPSPLAIKNGICDVCDSNCKTCYLVYNNCTACYTNSSYPYLSVSNTSLGTCLTTCSYTYYGDLSTGVCLKCSTLPLNCDNCSSSSTCYNCNSGYIFYNSQCLSYIPLGYYNNSGTATACSSSCATCLNLPTNCTSCVNLSLSYNLCVPNCPSGTVSVNLVCTACAYQNYYCFECYNIPTNCTSCYRNITPPVYLIGGSCLFSCPNYTYADSFSASCLSCKPPCQLCTTSSLCLSCVANNFLYNQTCSTSCPSGYIGLNRACTPCTNNCNTCLGSASHCLSCNYNYYLYNTSAPTCVNPCPNGTYKNVVSQMCTGCTSPCLTCLNFSDYCLTCSTGYLFNATCVTSCSLGYYVLGTLCQVCPSNCSSCSSSSICLSCASGLYLYINSCVQTCPIISPIVNSAGTCSWCSDPSCVNCSTLDYCYLCFYPKLLFQGACLTSCPTGYVANVNLTGCQLSSSSNNTSTDITLTNSLTSTSLFPVPFTIAAAFLGVACLMSKFQHQNTFVAGSLYALYGILEWGATIFLLLYYYAIKGKIIFLAYLLIGGGLAFNYFLNLLFLFIQNCSLRRDKRLQNWLQGSCNWCWYCFVSFIGLLTTNKFKNILFCKLFNLRILSAKLENIGELKVYYAYCFISFVSSVAVIGGAVIFMIDEIKGIDQLYMCYIDVLILSLLNLFLAILNSRKQDNYFDDVDQNGIAVHKRVEEWDEVLNANVMPKYSSILQKTKSYKAQESARKLQLLQSLADGKSFRDFSMQAEQILGQRSLISRLGTQSVSQLNFFEPNNDISVQIGDLRQAQDVSVGFSAYKGNNNERSVQYQMVNKSISVQLDQLQKHQISIQYAPLVTDQTVHMTKEEQDLGIQVNEQQQNISIQYSAKPIFEHVSQELNSDINSLMHQTNSLQQQKREIENYPAVEQKGMKVQLQLDVDQKLRLKERELQKLQQERRARQKQEAIKMFQKKIAANQDNSAEDSNKDKNAINLMFNNQESAIDKSSFINSKAEIPIIGFGQQQHNSNTQTEKQFIEMLSKNIDAEQINISLSKQEQNINKKIEFKIEDKVLASQELFVDENQYQDVTNRYQLANANNLQNYNGNSVQKSRSTNWQTSRMPPKPPSKRLFQPSDNQIQKSQHLEQEIIDHPINPRFNSNYRQNRNNRDDDDSSSNKVNLTQYLKKKERNLTSAQNSTRKNNLMDEDDALARELETQIRQQPLPRPRKQFPAQGLIPSSLRRGTGYSSKDMQSFNMQFDNRDKIVMLQNNDELMQQTKNLQNQKNRGRDMLSRSNSKKSIQKVNIQHSPNDRNSRGYLHQTYSSAEKRRSLQKIYLNKLVKK